MTVHLKCLHPQPMATHHLLLIPFAGGGRATFHGWPDALPPSLEAHVLQLPGREDRLNEPAFGDWHRMLEAAVAALDSLPNLPLVILGHSLGAVIAFELARALRGNGTRRLAHLFVAARPWPGAASNERMDTDDLTDEALLAYMNEMYGSLSTSLAHPEIRDLALPILRADLALLQSYTWRPGQRLEVPITVFGGIEDPVTPRSSLDAWARETACEITVEMLPGGHFFLDAHRETICRCIDRQLSA